MGVAAAEQEGAVVAELAIAKALLKQEKAKREARTALVALEGSSDVEALKEALKEALEVGLEANELKACETRVLALEAEANLQEAIARKELVAFKGAIDAAKEQNANPELIQQAEEVYAEEEKKENARQLLEEACSKCKMELLKEAVEAAKTADLLPEEYAKAEELL